MNERSFGVPQDDGAGVSDQLTWPVYQDDGGRPRMTVAGRQRRGDDRHVRRSRPVFGRGPAALDSSHNEPRRRTRRSAAPLPITGLSNRVTPSRSRRSAGRRRASGCGSARGRSRCSWGRCSPRRRPRRRAGRARARTRRASGSTSSPSTPAARSSTTAATGNCSTCGRSTPSRRNWDCGTGWTSGPRPVRGGTRRSTRGSSRPWRGSRSRPPPPRGSRSTSSAPPSPRGCSCGCCRCCRGAVRQRGEILVRVASAREGIPRGNRSLTAAARSNRRAKRNGVPRGATGGRGRWCRC